MVGGRRLAVDRRAARRIARDDDPGHFLGELRDHVADRVAEFVADVARLRRARDGVRFELVSLVVSGIAPWSGPELGGTVVTIAGSGLSSAADLLCRFGGSSSDCCFVGGCNCVRDQQSEPVS